MKIKKFIVDTMPEAMQRIRSELGEDAVILSSKEIETGGFLGFFTKKKLEVIAAIDEERRPKPRRVERPKPKKRDVYDELSELKQLVHQISEQIDEKRVPTSEYPAPFQTIDDHLRRQGVTKKVRLQLMKHLLRKWSEQADASFELSGLVRELDRYVERELAKCRFGGIDFQKKVVVIVGPTGVGKTTTIAKIAADSVLKKHKKVALITTDTYRIAAVDQLKTYAKILNIPIEVAYSIDDFKNAVEQFARFDLIIVDSAGRNFRNPLYVEELSKVIDFDDDVETFLTLSLTSKYEDMKEIVDQFSLLPIEQVILTKKDETGTFGAMFNIPFELKKGIAYVTDGQNVPDDFVEASIPYIKRSVIGEIIDE